MNYIPVGYRRRQKIQYGAVVTVAMAFVALTFLAWMIYNPAPERYIDQGDDHCVGVGYEGKFFPCQDPRFIGVNMNPTYVPPGTKLEDLERTSKK